MYAGEVHGNKKKTCKNQDLKTLTDFYFAFYLAFWLASSADSLEMADQVALSGPRSKSLTTITPSEKKMLSSNFNPGEEP